MSTFNANAFRPNTEATLEQAIEKLKSLGYKNFTFKSLSRSNGVSFYFYSEEGKEIRVSDHRLTGNRAFNTIQVDLYEVSTLRAGMKSREVKASKFKLSAESIERARLKKEARLAEDLKYSNL